VDYVVANYQGYVSLVRAAAGGDEALRQIYEAARAALTDRVFGEGTATWPVPDTPAHRLLVRGWTALVEELTLAWMHDPHQLSRDDLLEVVAGALPVLVSLGDRP
jgi:hypothetical protein